MGKMNILGEFKIMYKHLNGKLCVYHHAEMPKILYESESKKCKTNTDTNDKDIKIIKKENPSTWHLKLKRLYKNQ
jgi:hypothetical protein